MRAKATNSWPGHRRLYPAATDERDDVPAVLLREQDPAARHTGARRDRDRQGRDFLGSGPDPMGGVPLVDPAYVLGRSEVAAALEPLGRARVAAGRVHDELGRDEGRDAAVAVGHDDADDPGLVLREGQVEDRAVLPDLDPPVLEEPETDVPLEQRTADQQHLQPGRDGGKRLGPEAPDPPLPRVTEPCPLRDQVVGQPGEPSLEQVASPVEQAVRVPALRHAAAGCRLARQVVAVQDGHPVHVIDQRSRSQQAGDAAAHDDDVARRACARGGGSHRHHPIGARMSPTVPRTLSR